MKKLKYISITFIVFIMLILAGIFLYPIINQSKFWYCSPSELRGHEEDLWKQAFSPSQPPEKIDEHFLDNYTVTSDGNSYKIKYPSNTPPAEPFAFELFEMTPGQSTEIDGGTIEYVGAGTVFLDANNVQEKQVKFRFFDAANQLVSTSDAGQNLVMYHMKSEYVSNFISNPFPYVNFGFHYDNIEDIKINSVKIFDAKTHKSLSSGYSYSQFKNYCWPELNVSLWHRTPVDVVLDLSYGPSKIYEFPAKAGEGFGEDNFKCTILDLFEGIDTSRGWGEAELNKTTKSNSGAILYLVCQPIANYIPVTFEVLDKNGKIIRGSQSTGNYNYLIVMDSYVEKAVTVKAKYHSRRARLVVHLPYIPGLPEQNDSIKNLFDVYVPYINFANSRDMQQFLQKTLQLNNFIYTGQPPLNNIKNIQFPMSFSNSTIHDIGKIYATGGTLNVDIENDKLEMQYPVPLKEKFRQFVNKIMQRK